MLHACMQTGRSVVVELDRANIELGKVLGKGMSCAIFQACARIHYSSLCQSQTVVLWRRGVWGSALGYHYHTGRSSNEVCLQNPPRK